MIMTEERKPVCWCFSTMENSDADCGFQVTYYTSEQKAREAMEKAVAAHIAVCGTPPVYGDENYDEETNCLVKNRNKVLIKDGLDRFIWSIDPVIPVS
jgi:hypothetical protein